MKIKYLEFTDRVAGWHIEKAELGPVDVLVGRSGAGKTTIVTALDRILGFGTSEHYDPGTMEWCLAFEHEGIEYRWEGLTESGVLGTTLVTMERLIGQGMLLVDRRQDDFRFAGKRLRKHVPWTSALTQLARRKQLRPVVQALQKVVVVDPLPMSWQPFFLASEADDPLLDLHLGLDDLKSSPTPLSPGEEASLSRLLAQIPGLSAIPRLIRLYLLQELARDAFDTISRTFMDLFPGVEELHVFLYAGDDLPFEIAQDLAQELDDELDDDELDTGPVLDVCIRESGQHEWISSFEMSESMLRTLALLVDLHQAEPGTAIVIDDVEADLGADVLPRLVDLLLARADCQLILTSKHPCLLERIPVTNWKLVLRDGQDIRVEPVSAMADLDHGSCGQTLARLLARAAALATPVSSSRSHGEG